MITLKAVYRVVPLSMAGLQDTLIYNLKDGFAWVRSASGDSSPWSVKEATAVGAEIQARKAGLDPQAVAYVPKC